MSHVKWLILLFSLVSVSSSSKEKNIGSHHESDITTTSNGEEFATDYIDESLDESPDVNVEFEQSVSPKITVGSLIGPIVYAAIVAWFFWQIGLTPIDVIHGVPFHKHLTRITFPESPVASNTKTITVSFRNFKGVPMKNPLTAGTLSVSVSCDNIIVPMTSLIESDNEEEVCIIFNATRAGNYTILLKSNIVNVIRGFPITYTILAEDVDPLKTLFYRLRSHTLILTAGNPEDLKLSPHDKVSK